MLSRRQRRAHAIQIVGLLGSSVAQVCATRSAVCGEVSVRSGGRARDGETRSQCTHSTQHTRASAHTRARAHTLWRLPGAVPYGPAAAAPRQCFRTLRVWRSRTPPATRPSRPRACWRSARSDAQTATRPRSAAHGCSARRGLRGGGRNTESQPSDGHTGRPAQRAAPAGWGGGRGVGMHRAWRPRGGPPLRAAAPPPLRAARWRHGCPPVAVSSRAPPRLGARQPACCSPPRARAPARPPWPCCARRPARQARARGARRLHSAASPVPTQDGMGPGQGLRRRTRSRSAWVSCDSRRAVSV